MKKFGIVGNKLFGGTFRTLEFEIVDKVESNYRVWAIGGTLGTDEYIPFCEMLHPEDPKDYSIKPDTLKVVKLPVEEVLLLREATDNGVGNKEKAEKALESNKEGKRANIRREYARKTLPIFERITKE